MDAARPAPPEPSRLPPVEPLEAALPALPLALLLALAWAPWVPPLGLAGAVVLPFLARRRPDTAEYAPWAAVFAALPAFAWPAPSATLEARFAPFFATLALAYLVGAALDGAAQGSRWAWLAPLLAFLVWPTAYGALGGLGLAALGAARGREGRARGGERYRSRRAALTLGAAGLLALLAALPMPSPRAWRWTDGEVAPSPVERRTTPEPPAGIAAGPPRRGPAPASPLAPGASLLLNLATLALAVAVGAGLVALARRRLAVPPARRGSWAALIPLVAALALALVVLLWSFTAYTRGGPRPAGPVATVTPPPPPGEPPDLLVALVALAQVAAIAYVVVYLLRLARRSRPEPEMIGELPVASARAGSEPEATGRVRAAYRAFLALADGAGLGRTPWETPLEFAGRLGALVPETREPAGALAGLYEPVRYGGRADEAGALEAEAALRSLRGVLAPEDAA